MILWYIFPQKTHSCASNYLPKNEFICLIFWYQMRQINRKWGRKNLLCHKILMFLITSSHFSCFWRDNTQCTYHFLIDFSAFAFRHLILHTYRYYIIQCRMTCAIYRCRMFTIIPFCASSQVVSRGKVPMPLVVIPSLYHKTKVLAMIILVVHQVVENHTTKHFLYILPTLGKKCRPSLDDT